MNVLVCLLSLALAAYCLPVLEDVETEWIKFQRLHTRTYKSSEEAKARKSIFIDNYQKIAEHNELYAKGDKSHYLKIDNFADMTPDEVKQLRGYRNVSKTAEEMNERQFVADENVEIPDVFHWRIERAVTVGKNQGSPGTDTATSMNTATKKSTSTTTSTSTSTTGNTSTTTTTTSTTTTSSTSNANTNTTTTTTSTTTTTTTTTTSNTNTNTTTYTTTHTTTYTTNNTITNTK